MCLVFCSTFSNEEGICRKNPQCSMAGTSKVRIFTWPPLKKLVWFVVIVIIWSAKYVIALKYLFDTNLNLDAISVIAWLPWLLPFVLENAVTWVRWDHPGSLKLSQADSVIESWRWSVSSSCCLNSSWHHHGKETCFVLKGILSSLIYSHIFLICRGLI